MYTVENDLITKVTDAHKRRGVASRKEFVCG